MRMALAHAQSLPPRPFGIHYSYSPPAPGRFRLLQILSIRNDVVQCELTHVDINTSTDYIALSYVWGDEDPDHQIGVNGRRFDVTCHLYTAIKTLFKIFWNNNKSGTLLWIDAICIDQTNLREKAIQVPLMCDIYGKASHVFIWLGFIKPDNLRSWLVMDWLTNRSSTEHAKDEKFRQKFSSLCKASASVLSQLVGVNVSEVHLEALYEALRKVQDGADSSRMVDLEEYTSQLKNSMLDPENDFWIEFLTFSIILGKSAP